MKSETTVCTSKRMIALALCLALIVPCCIPAVSAASYEEETAAQSLYDLGLFRGTGTNWDGSPIFDLDSRPTRGQAVIMLVRLLGKEEEALQYTPSDLAQLPFTDVSDVLRPYVLYAYRNGLTNGISATQYGSSQHIRANQYVSFVLRALEYVSGTDFTVSDPWALSDAIGLTRGEYGAHTSDFTRGDVAVISNNALGVQLKNSGVTLLDYLDLTDLYPSVLGTATLESYTYWIPYYYDGDSYYGGAPMQGLNLSTFNGKTEYYTSPGQAMTALAIALDEADMGPSENPFLAGEFEIYPDTSTQDGKWEVTEVGNIEYRIYVEEFYSPVSFQKNQIRHITISYGDTTVELQQPEESGYKVHVYDGVKSYVNNYEYLHYYYICINDLLKQFGVDKEFGVFEVGDGTMAWTLA